MAVKTSTIDLEVRVKTGRDLLRAIERVSLSEETLDAIETQIAARAGSEARAAKL